MISMKDILVNEKKKKEKVLNEGKKTFRLSTAAQSIIARRLIISTVMDFWARAFNIPKGIIPHFVCY